MHFQVGGFRDREAAGLAVALQPGGDVDAFPGGVVLFHDDVAEADADPHVDGLVVGQLPVLGRKGALNPAGALHGVDDAVEERQEPVARRPAGPGPKALELWLDHVALQHGDPVERAEIVLLDQPAVADQVPNDGRLQPPHRRLIRRCRRRLPMARCLSQSRSPLELTVSPAPPGSRAARRPSSGFPSAARWSHGLGLHPDWDGAAQDRKKGLPRQGAPRAAVGPSQYPEVAIERKHSNAFHGKSLPSECYRAPVSPVSGRKA